MIRTARVLLFGKKFWEFPLFSQRIRSETKPSVMEFSAVADEEESTMKEPKHLRLSATKTISGDKYKESYKEMKYAFLRQIFNAGLNKSSGFVTTDSALKEFFNNLPGFSPPEIVKVIELLASTNNRPIASLKAICGLLHTFKNWHYTAQDCCTLLYSLAKLSYRDEEVIKIMVENLKSFDDFHSPRVASFILFSLSDLKWRDPELLTKLLKYILSINHSIKTSLTSLRAVCVLNYDSKEVDQLIGHLSNFKQTDFTQSVDFVNFIWSCVVLNKQNFLSPEQISTVLCENFVTMLLNNGVNASTKWKLLNINGMAKQMKNYDGPLLNSHSHYKIMSLSLPKQRTAFLESVMDSLSYIVPQSAQLRPLVNTGAGFYLDFEYYDHLPTSGALIGDTSKIGVMLLNYHDICSDKTMSGLSSFKLNILKGLGYKVLIIKHTEYSPSDPLNEKIEFLRKKIHDKAEYQ